MPSAPFYVAMAWAQLGDNAVAVDNLAQTRWTERFQLMYMLRYHPLWDPVRGDPRFRDVLAEAERAWGLR